MDQEFATGGMATYITVFNCHSLAAYGLYICDKTTCVAIHIDIYSSVTP